MFSNTHRERQRARLKQPKSSKTTTRFYDPYFIHPQEDNKPVSLAPGDTLLLHDETLITIRYFEYEIDESTLGRLQIEVYVVGKQLMPFRVCDDLGGFLADDRREVYMMKGKTRQNTNLINRKVTLIKTNVPYPAFKSEPPYTTYVCRYRKTNSSLITLSAKEATPGRTCIDPTRLRKRFQRKPANSEEPLPSTQYTFGDAFCGVGGCSAGARQAGFNVHWAFDGDKPVCDIYRANFPHTDVFAARAHEFVVLNKDKLQVDLLHMSPPCQTWSMAHTTEGKDDDANSASLFAVKELLECVRPRIATVEQVPGILSQDNRNFFNAMLRGFLEMGYSHHWKLLPAENYGVPQLRKRLFIIAACPGQPLPPFPPSTHGLPGLPPHVSLRQALQNIPYNDRLHIIQPLPRPRFSTIDFYQPYPGTIMASSNENNVHPCGTRYFTYREYARIQTFSDSHVFGNKNIKRQIGNAVPPLLAERIFESCLRALKETDGVPVERDVVEID